MIGLLSTIPVMLLIILFIAKSVSIIRRDMLKKLNQTTRRFRLIMAGGLIIAVFAYFLEIINGICFDLLPQDPYILGVLDRWTMIGGYFGIFLIETICILAFIRHSFLLNISKDFAKNIGIAFFILLLMTGCPIILEACLFSSKSIQGEPYLTIARGIFIGGSFCSYSFVWWYIFSVIKATSKLAQAKKIPDKKKTFRKLYFFAFLTLVFSIWFFIFFNLAFAAKHRSNEYIIFYNLAGSCIGLSALCLIDWALIINSKLVEIINQSNGGVQESDKQKNAIISLKPLTKIQKTLMEKETLIISDL